MRLDRIILNDFLTYEHLDYTFESKPLLVQGLNLTDDEQKTNGTGKSGLQTGIEQCITASNSRDVRDNEIVTYGKKQARAQLYASCDIRKEILHIDWDIKLSGSNVLRLKVKGYESEEWKDVSFSNVNDGKKAIMEWFAISKEDLFNYYIINNTRFKSFFKSSNTDKVALINRFSDASIVEGIDNIDTSELTISQKETERLCDSIGGKIEFIESQIEKELSRDLEEESKLDTKELDVQIEDIEEEIESLQDDIKALKLNKPLVKLQILEKLEYKEVLEIETLSLQEQKAEINLEISEAHSLLESAQKLVDDFEVTNWEKERESFKVDRAGKSSDLKLIESEKREALVQEKKILEFLHKVEISLSGSIKCPSCSHEFILDGDIDKLIQNKKTGESLKLKINETLEKKKVSIEEVKLSIEKLEQSISKINDREGIELNEKSKLSVALNVSVKAANDISYKLKGIESKELRLISLEENRLSEIKILESTFQNFDTEIANVKKEISNYKVEISSLEKEKSNLVVGSNKDQIDALGLELEALKLDLNAHKLTVITIGDEIYEKNQWSLNFKKFRMHLANQSLEVIEYHCNRYLEEMSSDLSVKMEGFKLKADGTPKEEITATIIRGIERTFSSFSGGERGRLLFASILANRYMINETHPYGGLDFLAIDEVFEGVDSVGLSSLIDSAKLLSIPVLLITHVSVEENDNVLTIVKEYGISKIKK